MLLLRREAEEEKWKELKVITSVYVTGLPDDVTEAELAQVRFWGLSWGVQKQRTGL